MPSPKSQRATGSSSPTARRWRCAANPRIGYATQCDASSGFVQKDIELNEEIVVQISGQTLSITVAMKRPPACSLVFLGRHVRGCRGGSAGAVVGRAARGQGSALSVVFIRRDGAIGGPVSRWAVGPEAPQDGVDARRGGGRPETVAPTGGARSQPLGCGGVAGCRADLHAGNAGGP